MVNNKCYLPRLIPLKNRIASRVWNLLSTHIALKIQDSKNNRPKVTYFKNFKFFVDHTHTPELFGTSSKARKL